MHSAASNGRAITVNAIIAIILGVVVGWGLSNSVLGVLVGLFVMLQLTFFWRSRTRSRSRRSS